MARKIEELLIEIQGQNKDLLAAIKGSEKGLAGLESKSGSMFKGMAKGAALAGTAIAGIGAAAVGLGVKIAGETELAKVAFTTLLGSADAAQSMIEDLRDFAARTPFEFAGVRDAAQKFLAMGFSAEQVIPILTSVGDAVAAMGGGQEEIAGVTRALTQIQAKGKVAAEEMLQLAERGIPAWEFLAAKLGTDIPSAMKEVSNGAVESGVFIAAFMEGTANRFGGAMEAQSQTLMGLFSTLKDTINVELGAAAEGLIEPLKAAIPLLADALGGIIRTALPPLAEAIGSLLPVVIALLPALGSIAGVVGKIIGALAPILVKIAEALVPVIDALIPIVEELLPVLMPLLETFVILVEALAPLLIVVATAVALLLRPLAALVAKNQEVIQKALKPVVGWLETLADRMKALGGLLSRPMEELKADFLRGWDVMKEGFRTSVEAVVSWLRTRWPVILAIIAGPLGLAVGLVIRNWDAIKEATASAFEWVKGTISSKWQTVKDLFSDTGAFFMGVWDSIKNGLDAAMAWVIDKINAAIALVNKLPGIEIPMVAVPREAPAAGGGGGGSSGGGGSPGGSGSSGSSSFGSTVKNAVSNAVSKTVSAAKAVGSAIASAAKKTWSRVKSIFSHDDPQNDATAFRWGFDFGDNWTAGMMRAFNAVRGMNLAGIGAGATGRPAATGGSVDVGGIHVYLSPGEGTAEGVKRGVLGALREAGWERRVGAQQV